MLIRSLNYELDLFLLLVADRRAHDNITFLRDSE